jgi:hypothetical protein
MDRHMAVVPARRMNTHLSSDELAAMGDGGLPATRRAFVSAHLAVCRECRSELALVTRIVETAPPRRPASRPWVPLSLGIAAATALLFVSLPLRHRHPGSTADVRSTVLSATAISVIAPTAGSSVGATAVRFSWHAVPGVSTYRLFITDSAGVPVRTLPTTDTTVNQFSPPLVEAGSYFWYVDALRVDGSSISSAQIGFSIRSR